MDILPPGSRGALGLHPGPNQSTEDVEASILPSQQWTFQSDQPHLALRARLSPLTTSAAITQSATLTPATAPVSEDPLSIYPDSHADAAASVDADILAAQRFLRNRHPDVEIPDFILAQVIHDNATLLRDAACSLDGSVALAEAQAIALLGPLTLPTKRIYAVVCIGGPNRNLLLLHQLHIHARHHDEQSSNDSSSSAAPSSLSEAPSSNKLSFIPAHRAQHTYKTPILQILSSPDRQRLAVRTHSSTTFLSLGPSDASMLVDAPRLETLHHVRFGQHGFTQHHDIVFSPHTPDSAAAVDRNGNISLYRLPRHESCSQPPETTASPRDTSPAPSSSPVPKLAPQRKHAPPKLASAQTPSATTQSVQVDLIDLRPCLERWHQQNDTDDPDGSSATDPLRDAQPYLKGPYRIAFGKTQHSIVLLSRHLLLTISLSGGGASSDTALGPHIDTAFHSTFSVTSFRRASFVSMATSASPSNHPIIAVCSTDTIYWFHLGQSSRPLFAISHHRGDDRSLTLTELPQKSTSPVASEHDHPVTLMWALSSRRNNVVSCFTLSADTNLLARSGPERDQAQSSRVELSPAHYRLGDAPVLLPSSPSPPSQLFQQTGAPPLFVSSTEILQQLQPDPAWLEFQISDRGALQARLFTIEKVQTEQHPPLQRDGTELEVAPPAEPTELYVDDALFSASVSCEPESLSNVKTRIVHYQYLKHAVFSARQHRDVRQRPRDMSAIQDGLASELDQLSSESSTAHVSTHATTLSLGQLLRSASQLGGADTAHGADGTDAADTSLDKLSTRSSWLVALDAPEGDSSEGKADSNILALRRDVRHALSSLGISPAHYAWSRSASAFSPAIVERGGEGANPVLTGQKDPLEHVLHRKTSQSASYLPTRATVQSWKRSERSALQQSLQTASQRMILDLALESEIFIRPKARILDEGASTHRPQQRRGTNWTAFEHREIYGFVEEQGGIMPPPHIGSIGLSFFAPLRSTDLEAAATASFAQSTDGQGLSGAELEGLLPSTSSTARLLLSEWQLGEDPTEYAYVDPFEGLHRLPRASRLQGSTARARSRSFSRASSASTEDRSRSRSRSRSRKPHASASLSQPSGFVSPGPPSSYPPSLISHSQPVGASSHSLVSRRKRPLDANMGRPHPSLAPHLATDRTRDATEPTASHSTSQTAPNAPSVAQSQPAPPRFGSMIATQIGAASQTGPTVATQVEAGRFGARPSKPDRPPKKKRRASGF